ncbi:MAG: hypothetical protein J5726_04085 [Treponema sp.]|nr:hypothetical protein [Treponema sp.]
MEKDLQYCLNEIWNYLTDNDYPYGKINEVFPVLQTVLTDSFSVEDEKSFILLVQIYGILLIEKKRNKYGTLTNWYEDLPFNPSVLLLQLLEHRLGRKIKYDELTVNLLFSELEKCTEPNIAFYKDNTRYLFIADSLCDDTDKFFRNINNHVFNKLYEDTIKNSNYKREGKNEDLFLPVDFTIEDVLKILPLLGRYNKKDFTHSIINKLEIIESLFKELFSGTESKDKYDSVKAFRNTLEAFQEYMDKYPALIFFVDKAASELSYKELEAEFPGLRKKEELRDYLIYCDLMENRPEIQNNYSAMALNYMAFSSFNNDVGDRKKESDDKMKLFQKIFTFALLKFVKDFVFSVGMPYDIYDDSVCHKYMKIADTFFQNIKDNNFWDSRKTAEILNEIFELTFINKATLFAQIDFCALNKSSHFNSNEIILHLYFTLSNFNKDSREILTMLDFIREAQLRIIPLKENVKRNGNWYEEFNPPNAEELQKIDCGFTMPFLSQPVCYGIDWENWIYRKDFTFRLWSESKQNFDECGKNQSWDDFNKCCLRTHFFHSADRNMQTHFCSHHALKKIISAPRTLVKFLRECRKYLDEIEEYQDKKSIGVAFLIEKYNYITSNIALIAKPSSDTFDGLFDKKGELTIDFNLKEDFGEAFYDTVNDFLEVMLTAQSDLYEIYKFELMSYLIYITFSLVQKDAESTNYEDYAFKPSPQEQERWKKTLEYEKEYAEKNNIHYSDPIEYNFEPYLIFNSQYNTFYPESFKHFNMLPVIAKIHLFNGSFEKLPEYIKRRADVLEGARKIQTLRTISLEWSKYKNSYIPIVLKRWEEFALSNKAGGLWWSEKLRKTWKDILINKEITTVDTYKQKLEKIRILNLNIIIAVALSDDEKRIELFLGEKTHQNNKPLCSITVYNTCFDTCYKEFVTQINNGYRELFRFLPDWHNEQDITYNDLEPKAQECVNQIIQKAVNVFQSKSIEGNRNLRSEPNEKEILDRLWYNFDPNKSVECPYEFDSNHKDDSTDENTTKCVYFYFNPFEFYQTCTVDVILKENNKELDLCFDVYEYVRHEGTAKFTIPASKYHYVPGFITYLNNAFSPDIINSLYEETTDGYGHKLYKCHVEEMNKIFLQSAKAFFKEEIKEKKPKLPFEFTPEEFGEKMNRCAYSGYRDREMAECYCELVEKNGIKQVIVSTGLDAAHIQLALTLSQDLCEIQVYLDEKTTPQEEPLFSVPTCDYNKLEQFFARLRENQLKDFMALKAE